MNRVGLTTFVTSAAHWSPGQASPPPTGTAAWPCRRPRALEISRVKPASPLRAGEGGQLKPASPLLAQAEPQLKPPSPLRAKRSCFSCIFRLQWCCRFQWSLFGGEQWCRWFHTGLHQWLQRCYWFQSWHVAVSCARKSSPSARKMAQISVFWRAVRVFRGNAAGGGVLCEFFRGKADGGGVLCEFFRGKADGGGVLGCDSGAGPRRIPPRITSGRVTRGRGYCSG